MYTIARNLVTDAYRQNGRATHLPLEEAPEHTRSPEPGEGPGHGATPHPTGEPDD